MNPSFQAAVGSMIILVFPACSTHTGTGALAGAAIGGGVGAVADGEAESVVKGAAIGATVGALVGALADAKVRSEDRSSGEQTVAEAEQYPTATRSSKENRVISPYPPHREIDVTGFRSGELVIDPTTNEVFRVP